MTNNADIKNKTETDRYSHQIEKLYRQHKDKMFSYCLYQSGDRNLSEDIVQDAFLKLSIQLNEKKEIKSPSDWLFICVRNLLYNAFSKMKTTINYDSLKSVVEIDSDRMLFLNQILGKLEHEERELILLKEQQGISTKEIAAMLELSDEAVRTRLYRVRKKMYQLGRGE